MNPNPESAGLRRLHRPTPGRRDDPALQARVLECLQNIASIMITIIITTVVSIHDCH